MLLMVSGPIVYMTSTRGLVQLTDPQTKRLHHIGSYASEEDAARAYDFAAVQAHGPGVERNFPGEAISELPETVGEEGLGRKRQVPGPPTP
jgi:hypothetical protein